MIGETGFVTRELTSRQKAAVIVRYLLAEGADLDLSSLPADTQAALAEEMALMGTIDRNTRDQVVDEFCAQIEVVGVTFPGGIAGTLDLLDGRLSTSTASRLRRNAILSGAGDPWARLHALPVATLAELARTEAVEISAILLSRLPVARAAEVLELLSSDSARQIAYAMSTTAGRDEQALHRIGLALVHAADVIPAPSTDAEPGKQVGAILNFSRAATRTQVLDGLEAEDAEFAEAVRKAIFTWTNIPKRLDPRDIARVCREVEGTVLIKAMAGAKGPNQATTDFFLSGMSGRLADSLREDIEAAGKIPAKDAEDAMSDVVSVIREMEERGDLFLISVIAEEEVDP